MAEESDQEDKTEDATDRHLEKGREDGQVPRSQELAPVAILVSALCALYLFAAHFMERIAEIFIFGFIFDRRIVFSDNPLGVSRYAKMMIEGLWLITPLFIFLIIVAILASIAMGGFNFSLKAVAPKLNKLDPIKGFMTKIISIKALVELLKNTVKASMIAVILFLFFMYFLTDVIRLGSMALEPALEASGEMIIITTLAVACSLILVVAIDVPYQLWEFAKRMRMTKQQVKDEHKDVEGQPEIKAKIKQKQAEMAAQRMLEKVQDADVVITNPQHFSVALNYKPDKDEAPIIVAKGVDSLAFRIREKADEHNVKIFESPSLARALYFTTKLEEHIPEPLYYAIAQVFAYIFGLDSAKREGKRNPKPKPTIPKEFRFNADGVLEK